MASPIGHALAGYAIYSVSARTGQREPFRFALLSIFFAVAADLDVFPGLLQGQPVLYHSGVTHSLSFPLVASFIAARLYAWRYGPFLPVFNLCFMAYSSHLLLDLIGPDRRPPYGIPLFWPISAEHHLSPVPLLLGFHHAGTTSTSIAEFLGGVLSLYNLAAISVEIALFAPIILWARRGRTITPLGVQEYLRIKSNYVRNLWASQSSGRYQRCDSPNDGCTSPSRPRRPG